MGLRAQQQKQKNEEQPSSGANCGSDAATSSVLDDTLASPALVQP